MIQNFGASIYPERSTPDRIKKYLKVLNDKKIKTIFISMLDYVNFDDKKKNEFEEMLKLISSMGFDVCVDIDNRIIQKLGLTIMNTDLVFFHKLGIAAIRLDYKMDGRFEAFLSKNKYGIKIYLNASTSSTTYIRNILSYGADTANLVASHNFYPQEFTGLDYDQYKRVTTELKSLGLKTSVFVTMNPGQGGEGPSFRTVEGQAESMSTLEFHRHIPLQLQTNYFATSKIIDEVIISTQYATPEMLDEMISGNTHQTIFKLNFEKGVTDSEKQIINFDKLIVREDLGHYIARCSWSTYFFKDLEIKPRIYDKKIIEKGSIVIANSDCGVYKGEFQIIRKDMPNDKKRNVIGHVIPEQMFMIDELSGYEFIKII